MGGGTSRIAAFHTGIVAEEIGSRDALMCGPPICQERACERCGPSGTSARCRVKSHDVSEERTQRTGDRRAFHRLAVCDQTAGQTWCKEMGMERSNKSIYRSLCTTGAAMLLDISKDLCCGQHLF